MRTLRVLDLGGNGIGDEGCQAIAAAVFMHRSLVRAIAGERNGESFPRVTYSLVSSVVSCSH
jgi:hypothetical protein